MDFFWLCVGLAAIQLIDGARVEQRVVNGYIVDPPNSFPWQLSLQRNGYHICGAVVYNSNYAITAAHCVDGSSAGSFRVQCGAHDISVTEAGRQTVSVSSIVMHPQYNPNGNGFPNDIAVLKLASPLTLDDKCQAAKLAPSSSSDFGYQAAVLTGWGRLYGSGTLPDKLKRGDVEVLPHSVCRSYWGSIVNYNYHICVKDIGDRIYGACNGDSGGPAQVGDTVVGLASFVASGCLPNYPSAYVRLSYYATWVDSTVASLG